MDSLAKKSISMEKDLYEKAIVRYNALGYKSFSEYIQFLIEADVSRKAPHVITRNQEMGKISYHDERPTQKVAEPNLNQKPK